MECYPCPGHPTAYTCLVAELTRATSTSQDGGATPLAGAANARRYHFLASRHSIALSSQLLSRQRGILPVRFDETEIPGLPPTIGYLDLRVLTPEKLVELIRQKSDTEEGARDDHCSRRGPSDCAFASRPGPLKGEDACTTVSIRDHRPRALLVPTPCPTRHLIRRRRQTFVASSPRAVPLCLS